MSTPSRSVGDAVRRDALASMALDTDIDGLKRVELQRLTRELVTAAGPVYGPWLKGLVNLKGNADVIRGGLRNVFGHIAADRALDGSGKFVATGDTGGEGMRAEPGPSVPLTSDAARLAWLRRIARSLVWDDFDSASRRDLKDVVRELAQEAGPTYGPWLRARMVLKGKTEHIREALRAVLAHLSGDYEPGGCGDVDWSSAAGAADNAGSGSAAADWARALHTAEERIVRRLRAYYVAWTEPIPMDEESDLAYKGCPDPIPVLGAIQDALERLCSIARAVDGDQTLLRMVRRQLLREAASAVDRVLRTAAEDALPGHGLGETGIASRWYQPFDGGEHVGLATRAIFRNDDSYEPLMMVIDVDQPGWAAALSEPELRREPTLRMDDCLTLQVRRRTSAYPDPRSTRAVSRATCSSVPCQRTPHRSPPPSSARKPRFTLTRSATPVAWS